jgi:hypothetical protein
MRRSNERLANATLFGVPFSPLAVTRSWPRPMAWCAMFLAHDKSSRNSPRVASCAPNYSRSDHTPLADCFHRLRNCFATFFFTRTTCSVVTTPRPREGICASGAMKDPSDLVPWSLFLDAEPPRRASEGLPLQAVFPSSVLPHHSPFVPRVSPSLDENRRISRAFAKCQGRASKLCALRSSGSCRSGVEALDSSRQIDPLCISSTASTSSIPVASPTYARH